MIAKNVTEYHLQKALEIVNQKYNNNVIFKRLTPEGRRYRFTLRVKDSKGDGAKTGYTGRHTISACWHVHGNFFDALLEIKPDAVIQSASKTISSNGGNWQDWNIGSILNPLYFSESCNCL